jgi:protein-tyrosine-phosphatase
MAEAIARRDASDMMEASSAGLSPLGFVVEMTKTTLIKNGCAADGLASKAISREALQNADIVINMSGRARETAFDNFAKVEDWQVKDPYDGDLEDYQRVFEDIERRVAELAERLRSEGSSGKLAGNIKGKGTGGRRRQ